MKEGKSGTGRFAPCHSLPKARNHSGSLTLSVLLVPLRRTLELRVATEGTELLLDLETVENVPASLGGAENLDFSEIAQGARMVTLAETAAQHSQQSAIVDVDQKPREEGNGDLGSAEPGSLVDDHAVHGADGGAVDIVLGAESDQKHMLDRAVVQVDHQVFAALALESGRFDGTAESTAGEFIESEGAFAELGVIHVGHDENVGLGNFEILEMTAKSPGDLEGDRKVRGRNENSLFRCCGFAGHCHFLFVR